MKLKITEFKELLKTVEKKKAEISKSRDEIYELKRELEDLLDSFDAGIDSLREGIVTLQHGIDHISRSCIAKNLTVMEQDNLNREELVIININKPPITVKHSELKEWEAGYWKRICPACNVGLLLVGRDINTFILQEIDRCILCGQQVIYEDIEEMRKQ